MLNDFFIWLGWTWLDKLILSVHSDNVDYCCNIYDVAQHQQARKWRMGSVSVGLPMRWLFFSCGLMEAPLLEEWWRVEYMVHWFVAWRKSSAFCDDSKSNYFIILRVLLLYYDFDLFGKHRALILSGSWFIWKGLKGIFTCTTPCHGS